MGAGGLVVFCSVGLVLWCGVCFLVACGVFLFGFVVGFSFPSWISLHRPFLSDMSDKKIQKTCFIFFNPPFRFGCIAFVKMCTIP